jgi:hypothetical protein
MRERGSTPARAERQRLKMMMSRTSRCPDVRKHEAQRANDRISLVRGFSRCRSESPGT